MLTTEAVVPLWDNSDEQCSGRFSVRVPTSLHKQLAVMAARERCSLNSLVNTILAEVAGAYQTQSLRIESDSVHLSPEEVMALKKLTDAVSRF